MQPGALVVSVETLKVALVGKAEPGSSMPLDMQAAKCSDAGCAGSDARLICLGRPQVQHAFRQARQLDAKVLGAQALKPAQWT